MGKKPGFEGASPPLGERNLANGVQLEKSEPCMDKKEEQSIFRPAQGNKHY